MEKQYCTAIVLAAGSGKRMGTKTHKQYLLIGGRPVLYYSLKAFQDSDLIDDIILVTGGRRRRVLQRNYRGKIPYDKGDPHHTGRERTL